MVALPRLTVWLPGAGNGTVVAAGTQWAPGSCGADCQAQLISFAVRCLLLVVSTVLVFGRRFSEALPRLFFAKWLLLTFVFLLTFAYWLFYAVRVPAR